MPTNNPGDNARNKLLTLERRRQTAVVSEFEKIQKRLTAELADLLSRIDKERKIDGNASPGLLIQKARIVDLLDSVTDEIKITSARLAAITTTAQSAAIDISAGQMSEYPELRGQLNFFDAPATKELIGLAGNGQPLAVHFAKLAKPVRQAMFDALFFGIAAGTPNQRIAREVRDAIGGTTAAAMTIVRTETNRAYREASRQFYADTPDVIGWRWLSALDLNTCPICWGLHGRIFKNKTKFGTHPNCRCTMVPVFAGDEPEPTGPDLFAKLNDAQKRAILGPRRLDLYNNGADLSDFIETNKSAFGIGRNVKPLVRTTFKIRPRTPNPPDFPTPPPVDRVTTKPALGAPATTKPALRSPNITPGESVPTFTSNGHAAGYMSARYPGITFDYAGFDPALTQTNAAEMARLLDLYPEIRTRLRKVSTTRRGSAYAQHWSTGSHSEIVYNVNGKFGNAAELRALKKQGYDIGWSVSDKEFSTTTHEFGHAVDYWILSNGSKTLNRFAFADGRNEISAIYERIRKELKPKYGQLSDYALQGRGRSQYREQFAEGFSMMHNRPPDQWPAYVRAQKLLIEKMQKSELFAAGDAVEFRNLSDAEKIAARKEFDDFIQELGLKVKK